MNPSFDDTDVADANAPPQIAPVVVAPTDDAITAVDSTQASPNIDPHESSLGVSSPLALSRVGADEDESPTLSIEPPSHHLNTTSGGIGRRASPSITSATSAQSYASHSPVGSTRTNATTTTVTAGRTRHRGAAVRYKSLEDAQASPVLTKANRSVTIDVKRSHDGSIIGAVGSMQGWRKTMEDRHVLAFASESAAAAAASRVPSSSFSPRGHHRGGGHHHYHHRQSSPPTSHLEPPQIQGVVRTLSSSDYQRVGEMCGSPPLQEAKSDSRRSSDTIAPPPHRGGATTTSGNATRTSSEPVSPGAVSVTFSVGRVASGHPIHGARMLSDSRRGSETESALVPRHGGHDQYFTSSNDRAMMGVFDGHRGPDAAAYASSILPRMLAPMLHGGDVLGTEGHPQSGSPSRRQSDQTASQNTFRRESTQSERTILSSETGSRFGSPTASAGAAHKLVASFSAHNEEIQTKRKTEVSDFITRAFQETDDLLRSEHIAFKEGTMDNRSMAGTQSSTGGGASFTSNGLTGGDGNTPAAVASSLLTIGGLGAYLQTHAPLSNASFDYNGGFMSENASFVSAWAGPSTYNNNNMDGEAATPRDMDGSPLTEAAPVVDHLGRFIQKPNADPGMQGATAHLVVVTDNNYLFCNLGDSRGYLCRRRVQRDLSPEGFARSWSVAQQQRHHSPRSSPCHTRGRVSSTVMPDEAPILLTGGLEVPPDVDSGVDTPPIATSSPRTTGGGGQFTLRKTTDAPGGLAIPHVQSYQGSPNLDRSRISNSPRYGFGAEEGGGDTSDGSPRTTPSEEPRSTPFTSACTAVFRAPSSNAASPNHLHQTGGGVSGEYSTSVVGSAFDDDQHEESIKDDEIDASGDLEESTTDIYGGYTIEAIPMSTDHRTLQNEAEKQRVLDAGGFVVNNRVNGKLSVTRAFGDFDLKPNMSSSLASRITKVESTVSAAAVTSNSTSMSSPLAIPSPESADTSTSAPLTPPQAMPPLAPRPVATSTTTSKNTASPAPPANPVSNTPDIAIVDRLGSALSSTGGVGSPMRTADGSLTSSAAAATPDPNNSPPPTALDIHSPYPFAAYDILLVGCDGVWELQTAEVIGKRAVDAIEAVLQPVRNAILQGKNFPITYGNDSTAEYPSATIPSLPPMYPPPNQHRGSTSTSGVVSPRKGSAHHTLSSCDARRFHTSLSVGGLTVDGRFIRTHSSHTATNEEGSRRVSTHVQQQQRQCSPNHSITHNDDPVTFSNEAMSVSLSPRSPRTLTVGETGEDVSSPMQLLTEKLESTLRDVVVTSLNAACSVHCDPKGTTPGCDNISLGIMLVAA